MKTLKTHQDNTAIKVILFLMMSIFSQFSYAEKPTEVFIGLRIDQIPEINQKQENFGDVADLGIGAQVLDHLIGLHDVRADLVTPGGFGLFAADSVDVVETVFPRLFRQADLKQLHRPSPVLDLGTFSL